MKLEKHFREEKVREMRHVATAAILAITLWAIPHGLVEAVPLASAGVLAAPVSPSSISAGFQHTCGIRADGTLACWGYNAQGQASPPSGTFSQVSAGAYHTCGVRTDGTLACWGYNAYGQASPPSGTFTQVSAGFWHTCGVRTDGTLACWGLNAQGQASPPSGTFSQVSAGGYHTCGLKTDGTLACWGDNTYGQASPPSGSFSLGDPPITAAAATFSATEGASFSGTAVSFTDPDSNATVSEYSATINWGDSSSYAGTISGSGGKFTVTGSHKYAEEGAYTITVTITDVDTPGNTATASSTASVADAALTITRIGAASNDQRQAAANVTFNDADPAGTLLDYRGTISWGDGTSSVASFTTSPFGGFAAGGVHNYASSGTYTVTITINDVGGASASAATTLTVPSE